LKRAQTESTELKVVPARSVILEIAKTRSMELADTMKKSIIGNSCTKKSFGNKHAIGNKTKRKHTIRSSCNSKLYRPTFH
jgi:hypothetical protein